MSRGLMSFLTKSINLKAASRISSLLSSLTAKAVPLYGNANPNTSIKQFIELAVNIPAQEPHVGQALASISKNSSSVILPSLKVPTASNMDDNVRACPVAERPAFIGPPEQKIAGTLVRTAANSIPGVILSQFGM